jgi:chitodextrinase
MTLKNTPTSRRFSLALVGFLAFSLSLFINARFVSATGCAQPPADHGTVTRSLTIPATATYHIWSRMAAGSAGDNTYSLDIDGTDCFTVGGSSVPVYANGAAVHFADDSSNWINKTNTGSTVDLALSAGTHSVKLIGTTSQVMLDRLLFTQDNCVPIGVGDNCVNTGDTLAPATPDSLEASNISSSDLVLNWAPATDNVGVDHYIVFRNGANVGTVGITSFTDTGLTPLTTYSYTVCAFDAAGNQSSASIAYSVTTLAPPDTTPPAVPANLLASNVGTAGLTLTWDAATDNIGVNHYVIRRDGVTIASPATPMYTDSNLSASTGYSYTVSAVDAAGNASSETLPTFVTTAAPPDTTAPSAPSTVTATAATADKVLLSWTAATDNVGIDHYSIVRDGTTLVPSQSELSFTDTTVAASTTYNYAVVAWDAAGNASVAATATATTLAPPDISPPTVPTGLTATANSQSKVTLSWKASTDNVGVDHYSLNRDGTNIVASQTGLSFIDTSVVASTTYSYTVTAWDAAGNASLVAAVSVTTPAAPDTIAPTVPTSLRIVSVTGTNVNLAWNAAFDNVGVVSYEVYRAGVKVSTSAGLSYTDADLNPATSYTYTVDAVDATGNKSAQSVAVSAVTLDTVAPSASATFAAQASALGQVTLSWSAASDNVKVTGYKLSRGGALIASLTTLTYTDSGLTSNTSYTYTLTAVDAAGNSSPVKALSVTTLLDAAPYGAGFAGAYFNNTTLSGPAIGRLDPTINFAWGSGVPIPGINADNFSVRWTGSLKPAKSGTYTFYTQSDDGIRLYLNDKLLINHWVSGGGSFSATAALVAGTVYNLRIEYYDTTATAKALLQWSGPGIAKAVLPASVMSSGSAGLSAAYFSNNNLSGAPTILRLDNNVAFDWGTGSPDSRMTTDNFSVRWTGKIIAPVSGTYTFYTDSDDGIRLWVNGQQLVNNWAGHSLTTNSGKIALVAGQAYDIKVEYMEQTGSAVAKLSWAYGSVAKTIIPSSALRDR